MAQPPRPVEFSLLCVAFLALHTWDHEDLSLDAIFPVSVHQIPSALSGPAQISSPQQLSFSQQDFCFQVLFNMMVLPLSFHL